MTENRDNDERRLNAENSSLKTAGEFVQIKNWEGVESINHLPGFWEADKELMAEFDKALTNYDCTAEKKYRIEDLQQAWETAWKVCGIDDLE